MSASASAAVSARATGTASSTALVIKGRKVQASEMLKLLSKDVPDRMKVELAKAEWYQMPSGAGASFGWKHAQTIVRAGAQYYVCLKCGQSGKLGAGTSNLLKHLRSKL